MGVEWLPAEYSTLSGIKAMSAKETKKTEDEIVELTDKQLNQVQGAGGVRIEQVNVKINVGGNNTSVSSGTLNKIVKAVSDTIAGGENTDSGSENTDDKSDSK